MCFAAPFFSAGQLIASPLPVRDNPDRSRLTFPALPTTLLNGLETSAAGLSIFWRRPQAAGWSQTKRVSTSAIAVPQAAVSDWRQGEAQA